MVTTGKIHVVARLPADAVPIMLDMKKLLPELKLYVLSDMKDLCECIIMLKTISKRELRSTYMSIMANCKTANKDPLCYLDQGEPWQNFMNDCFLLVAHSHVIFGTKPPIVYPDP